MIKMNLDTKFGRLSSKMMVFLSLLTLVTPLVFGQMKRERSVEIAPELFLAASVITLPSTTQLPASNMNFTIQHAFGPVSDGLEGLFGLDASSNIRFGFDYGLTDNLSIGIGRSRFDKVYDLRAKMKLMTVGTEASPTVISVFGNIGVDSQDNDLEFADRASSHLSVLVGHALTEKITLQVSPAWSHFNLAKSNIVFGGGVEREASDILTLGFATRYIITGQVSVLAEFIPVIGTRSDGSENAFSLGVDLEAGGHVFQMFLTSTQWIVPQYVASKSRDNFFDGDFGFGFNIHRVF